MIQLVENREECLRRPRHARGELGILAKPKRAANEGGKSMEILGRAGSKSKGHSEDPMHCCCSV